MQDQINYLIHKTYTPPYYHRQYEKDLPQEDPPSSKLDQAKRITHLALPFLSLHRPFGNAISIGMGTARVLTSGVCILSGNTMTDQAYGVMQLGLASLALSGTLYHFTLGLYLTTAVDISTNLMRLLQTLHQRQFQKAGDELLQTLTSGLYLAIIMTGSLEVVLASLLIQAFVSFYQARQEWSKGKVPEAMAKSLMGMIRLYQGNVQWEMIHKRNDLVYRYREIAARVEKSRQISHLWKSPLGPSETRIASIHTPPENHPIENISEKIDEHRVILEDAKGDCFDFGAHFYGYGKQQVKGMNVTFREAEDKTCLTFKVNHVFRDRLQTVLKALEAAPKDDLSDLLRTLGSHVEEISLERTGDPDNWWMEDSKYRLHLKGLGAVHLSAQNENITDYDKVTVTLDKGKSLYEFHEALSILDLEDALKQSSMEDIERMKLGHLFRAFSPSEATLFERSDLFFDLPLDEFKGEIIKKSPDMEAIIDQWLPKMELREILPGRMRYGIDGLADELKKQGALGLTASLTGAWGKDEIQERVASILKMGLLSHEMRDDYQIGKNGLSGGTDYYTGGADSVFTQMVTVNNTTFNEFAYSFFGEARLLFSPKILEMGTYQYHSDNFGSRIIAENEDSWFWFDDYLKRNNIFDFLTVEKLYFQSSNEVMVKDRIPPNFITGIVVEDQQSRDDLLNYLRSKDIVQTDTNGIETILSKPIDQFLWIGNTIYDEMFA